MFRQCVIDNNKDNNIHSLFNYFDNEALNHIFQYDTIPFFEMLDKYPDICEKIINVCTSIPKFFVFALQKNDRLLSLYINKVYKCDGPAVVYKIADERAYQGHSEFASKIYAATLFDDCRGWRNNNFL